MRSQGSLTCTAHHLETRKRSEFAGVKGERAGPQIVQIPIGSYEGRIFRDDQFLKDEL